jgi:polyferredoxin
MRLLRVRYLRLGVQFVLVALLNLTIIGSYWISPVLPVLRLDLPTDLAAGGQKTCTLGTALRSLTLFWPFMLLVLTIAILFFICIIVGRALCGWACPIGLFHDLISKTRQTFKVNTRELSLRAHNKLVGAKYAVLFIVLLVSLSMGLSVLAGDTVSGLYISNFPEGTTQTAPYCQYCPTPVIYYISNSMFMGVEPGLSDPVNLAMLLIFVGLVIGAVAIPRFWCRYLCPLGAFSSFFNKVSLLSIRKDQSKCTRCNYCVNSCPTRVQIIRDEEKDERVTDMNCDFCLECLEACPERALSVTIGNKAIYRGGKKGWWQQPPLKP